MRLKLPALPLKFSVALPGQGLSLFHKHDATPVRRIVLLALWGVLVFSLCLGSRMASARFADALRTGLPAQAGLRLKTKGVVALSFPPGAFVEALTILDAHNKPLAHVDAATVRLSLWSLATGRIGVNLDGLVKDGDIDATVASGFLFDTGAVKARARLRDVPLDAVPALHNLDKKLRGTVSGDVSFAAALDAPLEGDAAVSLAASRLDVSNFIPLLSPPRLPVMEVRLDAQCEEGVVTVESFQATGKDMDVSGQGKVEIKANSPKDSAIDITLRLGLPAPIVIKKLIQPKDYDSLKQGKQIDAHLFGTFDRPRISSR